MRTHTCTQALYLSFSFMLSPTLPVFHALYTTQTFQSPYILKHTYEQAPMDVNCVGSVQYM